VELEAAFAPFPTDDPVADLTRVNAFLERHVRALPAQYWWLHRRFKTRPPGEANPYGR
jgi:KDO2-lipid IV(A) lauroyltransferase